MSGATPAKKPSATNKAVKVKVFHAAFESDPVHIATVEAPHGTHVEACEYAFRWTQNIHDSWSKKMPADGNEAVTVEVPVGEHGHRSSMMGDRFEMEGHLYVCSGVGFRPANLVECATHP